MAGHLEAIGMTARYLPMSDLSGNVLAERRGTGGGASVMLYSPIDTHLEGDAQDEPWVGPSHFVDLKPQSKILGDWVYGLGASNPKALIATLTEVATAVLEADVPLIGDLMLGLADGGMPELVRCILLVLTPIALVRGGLWFVTHASTLENALDGYARRWNR